MEARIAPRVRRGRGRPPRRRGIAVAAFVLLLAVVFAVPSVARADPTTSHGGPTLVTYSSSVDHFPLSYYEWLPTGYSPSQRYPLAVFLHGMGGTVTTVRGGIGGDSISPELTAASSQAGFILISLNTRTASGFYFNSPCGGPQEQDVLDAIAHETSIRSVGAVYLIGFSMGTVGALTLAAHHRGLVAGIALAGAITDVFQVADYLNGVAPLTYDLCGQVPGPQDPPAVRFYTFLSPARFEPGNLRGLPIYVTAGGQDLSAPNNYSIWPYAQVNSTFVNASCQAATGYGEPGACTVPFWALDHQNPGSYPFRYVYEPNAIHSEEQFPASDVFAFFDHQVGPGFFTASFPPVRLVAVPPP